MDRTASPLLAAPQGGVSPLHSSQVYLPDPSLASHIHHLVLPSIFPNDDEEDFKPMLG